MVVPINFLIYFNLQQKINGHFEGSEKRPVCLSISHSSDVYVSNMSDVYLPWIRQSECEQYSTLGTGGGGGAGFDVREDLYTG
jgi:hypothetical protein